MKYPQYSNEVGSRSLFTGKINIAKRQWGCPIFYLLFWKKNHYVTLDTYLTIFIPQSVIITKSDIEHDIDRVYPENPIRTNTLKGHKKVRLRQHAFINNLTIFSFQI